MTLSPSIRCGSRSSDLPPAKEKDGNDGGTATMMSVLYDETDRKKRVQQRSPGKV
jgi:hypothetical protein